MKECHCGGNHSLRSVIGGTACECGARLNEAQVTQRIISRLNEIEEDQFKMIGALQRLGADKCDQCGDWDKDCWQLLDHCMCRKCLEGNPEGPLADEGLNESEYDQIANSVVRFLTSHGLSLHSKLLKPYYLAISK
jgi:hypothetical protein